MVSVGASQQLNGLNSPAGFNAGPFSHAGASSFAAPHPQAATLKPLVTSGNVALATSLTFAPRSLEGSIPITVRHSITLDGMKRLIEHLRGLGMQTGEPEPVPSSTSTSQGPGMQTGGLEPFPSDTVTSHQLQTFFRQRQLDPKTTFAQFYTAKPPDVAVTYQWSKSLTELLSNLESWQTRKFRSRTRILGEKIPGEPTFWVDIFFVDQTGAKDVTEDLRVANEIYQNAILHVALGSPTLLTRCWCLNEFAQRHKGISPQAEAARQRIPFLLRPMRLSSWWPRPVRRNFRQPPWQYIFFFALLPIFIGLSSLAHLGDTKTILWIWSVPICMLVTFLIAKICLCLVLKLQAFNFEDGERKTEWIGERLVRETSVPDDFFGGMEATVPEDMVAIKQLILEEYGSEANFNEELGGYVAFITDDYSSSDNFYYDYSYSDSGGDGGGDGDGDGGDGGDGG